MATTIACKYLILCQIKTTSIEMWSMAMNGQWLLFLVFKQPGLSTLQKRVVQPHIKNPNEFEFTWIAIHMCNNIQTDLLSYLLAITKILWSRDCYTISSRMCADYYSLYWRVSEWMNSNGFILIWWLSIR